MGKAGQGRFPRVPTTIARVETFPLSDRGGDEDEGDLPDADSLFNLPAGGHDEDEDER